jgi:DNA-binding Lrp family transcriptional regulator
MLLMNRESSLRLISELLKNSKQSDRNLAKILGISQPSVTRNRRILEKEAIRQYTIIPSLPYLGFEILALTFISPRRSLQAFMNEARQWAQKQPNVLFAGIGQGMESTAIMVSVHKDYAGFAKFQSSLEAAIGEHLKESRSFLLSQKEDAILKHLSFNGLVDESQSAF